MCKQDATGLFRIFDQFQNGLTGATAFAPRVPLRPSSRELAFVPLLSRHSSPRRTPRFGSAEVFTHLDSQACGARPQRWTHSDEKNDWIGGQGPKHKHWNWLRGGVFHWNGLRHSQKSLL